MKEQLIYHFFDDDEFLRISNKIKETEKKTAGEICVSVKEKRSFRQKKKTLRQLAEDEFHRLGIAKTRDSTGVLFFLILEDRQFYILADKGINQRVPQDSWDKIKDEMQERFLKGEFCKGILFGIEDAGKILSAHFPIKPDDTDELSNRVNII
jgi:uncharacterized membrane protein